MTFHHSEGRSKNENNVRKNENIYIADRIYIYIYAHNSCVAVISLNIRTSHSRSLNSSTNYLHHLNKKVQVFSLFNILRYIQNSQLNINRSKEI